MIFPLSFSLIVAILATAAAQQQQPTLSSRKSILDWSKCGTETKCFCVRGAQVPGQPQQLHEELAGIERATDTTPADEEGRCNVGVQNKFFTIEAAVFHLQHVGGDKALGSHPELMLYQGPADKDRLFGCKFDSASGRVSLEGNAEMIKTYRIDLFEDRSRFTAGNVLCAFKMENAYKFFKWMKDELRLNNLRTMMKFTPESDGYELAATGNVLFDSKMIKCDPYAFNDLTASLDYHVLPLRNRDKDVLNCDNYGPSYSLKFQNGPEPFDASELRCVGDVNNGFSFEIAKVYTVHDPTTGTDVVKTESVPVGEPEKFTLYCAANINEVCADPNVSCKDADCPKFNRGSKGTPATLECPSRKWVIDGEFIVLDADPVCQRDFISNANEAAFYNTFPSGLEDKTRAEARCFTDYDCRKKSNLDYSQCDDETKCGIVDYTNGIMKCKDPEKHLKIRFTKDGVRINVTASNYTCDTSTGLWIDATGEALPDLAQVRCFSNTTNKNFVAAKLSEMQVIGIIVGICVILAILLGGIPILAFICYKRRKVIIKDKKAWLKLKNSERIEESQKMFRDVLKTSTLSDVHIVHGFNMLELLLDAETESPKVWEEVYPFLMRFRGAIKKIDLAIWHMFSRFLYLQAKEIIDKHGWLCTRRIKKKKQKGLIRAVAIRLLTFAIEDPTNNETEELVIDGYRKLGFRAVEQYPHCGLLWSALLHVRPLRTVLKTEQQAAKPRPFKTTDFIERLEEIATKSVITMSESEVIPAFGTIAHQAAEALGSIPKQSYHAENGEKMMHHKYDEAGAVSTRYFEGICTSLTTNPTEIVLEACQMWPSPNPEFLAKMHQTAPESVWNRIVDAAIRLLAYYGRPVDMKRLHGRFMPTQPVTALDELASEQSLFEEAIENQKSELREWFAARTDKEELKRKPVYITEDDTVKLDARVEASALPGDAAKPATGSGSSSEKAASSMPRSVPGPAESPPPAAGTPPAAVDAAAPSPLPATPA